MHILRATLSSVDMLISICVKPSHHCELFHLLISWCNSSSQFLNVTVYLTVAYILNKLDLTKLELKLRVCDLWIMNQFLDPMNQKLVKLPFFSNCFFPKYGNFKMQYLLVFLSRVKWVSRLNDERTKFRKLCLKTLKLEIVNKIFTKQYF